MMLSAMVGEFADTRRDVEVSGLSFLPMHPAGSVVPIYEERFIDGLDASVAAVIATPDLAEKIPPNFGLAVAADPIAALFKSHYQLADDGFYKPDFANAIHPDAVVSPHAFIAEHSVKIGAGSVIGPNATILEHVVIGDRCTIGPGTVVGAMGFEVRKIDGVSTVLRHTGGVLIGNDVEIMANTCVVRALLGGNTTIGDRTAIDNMVQVGHNVQIGKSARIAAHALLGGSSRYGDEAWVGPNSTVRNSIFVGARSRISMGSVVTRDVPDDATVTGNFALPHETFLGHMKSIR